MFWNEATLFYGTFFILKKKSKNEKRLIRQLLGGRSRTCDSREVTLFYDIFFILKNQKSNKRKARLHAALPLSYLNCLREGFEPPSSRFGVEVTLFYDIFFIFRK